MHKRLKVGDFIKTDCSKIIQRDGCNESSIYYKHALDPTLYRVGWYLIGFSTHHLQSFIVSCSLFLIDSCGSMLW